MSEQQGNTTRLQGLLDKFAAGDEQAKDEIILLAMERLRRLARKMLSDFPGVRRWNETDDVFQNALVRLDRALRTERPESTRRFVGLAARHIRCELIDLKRHHYGPLGNGRHHLTDRLLKSSEGVAPLHDKAAKAIDPMQSMVIHEAVDRLDQNLREVFEMYFYLDMTHDEIAASLGVSSKTSKRRWRDAKLILAEALGEGEDVQS